MADTVALQAALGWQIPVLMSRISSALDLASIVTATGAGMSGSVTPTAAGGGVWAKVDAPVKMQIEAKRIQWKARRVRMKLSPCLQRIEIGLHSPDHTGRIVG